MNSLQACLLLVLGATLCKVTVVETKDCWDTKWYNTNYPSPSNRSDFENPPAPNVLENIRNKICYGQTLKAQCRDQKGKPHAQGTWNVTSLQYTVRCDTLVGIICHPYTGTVNATCPDFKIQYGCECPATTTAPSVTKAATTDPTTATSTGNPATASPGGSSKGSGNGVSRVVYSQCLLCLLLLFYTLLQ